MNSENYNVAAWGIAKDGMTNVLVIGESGVGKIMYQNPRTGKSIIHIENSIELLSQSPLNLNSLKINN